ncbi:solute carrier family 22 member 3-like [Anthonomus grandis grandis]|uniref:solute carrier family 22 member 3-like n=1 Tax=Anthonomus grandis grandis TaxID=2921223 RepID=UPI0021657BDD|nr:solute carrier family 22 member 3-like [Anthonomus grandis grandis]
MVAKSNTENVDHSLDSILSNLGDFGKYQIYVFTLICVAVTMHSMVHISFVFTAMDLDYRCKVPDCDSADKTTFFQPWLSNAIPYTSGHPEKCSMFAPHKNFTKSDNCSVTEFNTDLIRRCDEFVYNGEEKTILQEFDLQCDNNLWKLTLVGTINNIGQFFGLFISGFMSDRYGRKKLLIWGMALSSIAGCIKAFMPTYQLFLLFEFLDAAFGSGSYICGFVLGVELVGPKKRVLTGTIISSCYAIGEILLATIAWMVQSWRPLVLICYIPTMLIMSYTWLIPESIRWNLSKGNIKECEKTLKKLAKVNGKTISDKELEVLKVVVTDRTESTESLGKSQNLFIDALKSRIIMLRLVSCIFCWITCAFLFYGLTLNSVSLFVGYKYLDFILTALVEVPAYFVCNFVMEKYGRKKSLFVSYLLTGLACLGFIYTPPGSRYGGLAMYLSGKFGATAAFTILYVITSEIFPTTLRHTLMGICSTFGRFGSMISPQIPLLAQFWKPLPLVSFSIMSLLAALLTISFPETLHKKLPDTVKEAEDIGKALAVSQSQVVLTDDIQQQYSVEKF